MRPKFSNYTGVRYSYYWCQKSKSFVYGAELNISFLLQLIFAVLIVEEKIYDLKRLYLPCLVVLLREVTTHMLNRLRGLVFLITRKKSSLCEILKKTEVMKKRSMSRKLNLCTCVLERKKKHLWNFCKKCRSLLLKKDFKIAELLTKSILFSLYYRPS